MAHLPSLVKPSDRQHRQKHDPSQLQSQTQFRPDSLIKPRALDLNASLQTKVYRHDTAQTGHVPNTQPTLIQANVPSATTHSSTSPTSKTRSTTANHISPKLLPSSDLLPPPPPSNGTNHAEQFVALRDNNRIINHGTESAKPLVDRLSENINSTLYAQTRRGSAINGRLIPIDLNASIYSQPSKLRIKSTPPSSSINPTKEKVQDFLGNSIDSTDLLGKSDAFQVMKANLRFSAQSSIPQEQPKLRSESHSPTSQNSPPDAFSFKKPVRARLSFSTHGSDIHHFLNLSHTSLTDHDTKPENVSHILEPIDFKENSSQSSDIAMQSIIDPEQSFLEGSIIVDSQHTKSKRQNFHPMPHLYQEPATYTPDNSNTIAMYGLDTSQPLEKSYTPAKSFANSRRCSIDIKMAKLPINPQSCSNPTHCTLRALDNESDKFSNNQINASDLLKDLSHTTLKKREVKETASTIKQIMVRSSRGSVQFHKGFYEKFGSQSKLQQSIVQSNTQQTMPSSTIDLYEFKQLQPSKSKSRRKSVLYRHLWRIVAACMKLGWRLACIYSGISQRIQSTQEAPLIEASSLSYMLRDMKSEIDPTLSDKVKELIEVYQRTRSQISLVNLERLLSIRLRSFARFSLNQRYQFIEIMYLEKFPMDKLLVKEGHISMAFYFILHGQVEIFKIKDGLKYRINVLNTGDSFGDRTMNLLNDRRTACVGTTTYTELLRINKSDFFKIAQTTDERSITNRISQLSLIPYMKSSDDGFLEKAAHFFKCITYAANEKILLEGTDNLDIFWIIKGTCRCIKIVPFVQKRVKLGHTTTRTRLRPYNSAVNLADDEERLDQPLTVRELNEYDCFPDIPSNVDKLDQWMSDATFDKDQYLKFLSSQDPSSTHTMAYVSVIAKTKVEVMTIPRIDFCRLASARMIINFLLNQSLDRTPIEQLQSAYMERRHWEFFKKKVIHEVRKNRRAND